MRVRRKMTHAGLACFQGLDPMEVLVSYALHTYHVLDGVDYAERIKIRFVFNLFTHQLMTPVNFEKAVRQFGLSAQMTAKKVIDVCIAPLEVLPKQIRRNWSVEETMLLLAGAVLNTNRNLERLLEHRPPYEAWNQRVKRVICELRAHNMLCDEPPNAEDPDRLKVSDTYHHLGRLQEPDEEDSRELEEAAEEDLGELDEAAEEDLGELDEAAEEDPGEFKKSTCTLGQTHVIASIRQEDGRKTKSRRSTAHLRMARELRKLKMAAKTEKARRQKERLALQSKPVLVMESETEEAECDENIDHCSAILKECGGLLSLSKCGRRYSDFLYDISELLKTTSRKTYRILRQLLPLPSEVSLFSRFGQMVRSKKKELTDLTQLEGRIQTLLSDSKLRDTPVTIAINAFSFRTFTGRTIAGEKTCEVYSNAFLFLLVPLDFSIPVQVLHLEKKATGSYDDNIQAIFEQIRQLYTKEHGSIWFKATDGDRYLTKEHELFFAEHVEARRNDYILLLQELHREICKGCVMPIADPLHFAKNIRGKVLDHNVAVVDHESVIMLVDRKFLQETLNVKDALDDLSLLGRMRDVYVTKLFTIENVCTLIEKKKYAAALLFLPYASVFTVLYSTNLSTESRLFFAKMAYLAFNSLLLEAKKLVAHNQSIKHRFSSGCLAVTVAEPSYLKRMMHSCLALGIAILFGPNDLRLDALGTHLVENAIGVSRSIANSTKYDSICSAFATAEVRKEIARKYGITLYIPKRVNDGGAKINTVIDGGVEHPSRWDANDVVSMLVEACNIDLLPTCEEELLAFGSELRQFIATVKRRALFETSEVANALIVQRNQKFKCRGDQQDGDSQEHRTSQ